jgi:hypothetical protein
MTRLVQIKLLHRSGSFRRLHCRDSRPGVQALLLVDCASDRISPDRVRCPGAVVRHPRRWTGLGLSGWQPAQPCNCSGACCSIDF